MATQEQEKEQEQEQEKEQDTFPSPRPVDVPRSVHGRVASDQETADRAAAFIEDYAERYQRLRGSPYRRRDALEFPDACQLAGMWPDAAHLAAMVEVFLTTNHKFAREGSRTIRQFAALANWCDEQVKAGGESGDGLTTEAVLAAMRRTS